VTQRKFALRRKDPLIQTLVHFSLVSSVMMGALTYGFIWYKFRALEVLGLKYFLGIRAAFIEASLIFGLLFLSFLILVVLMTQRTGTLLTQKLDRSLHTLKQKLQAILKYENSKLFSLPVTDMLHSYDKLFDRLSYVINKRRESAQATEKLIDQLTDSLSSPELRSHLKHQPHPFTGEEQP
jgi:hypothetical protein